MSTSTAYRSRVNQEILQALSEDEDLFVLTAGRIYDQEPVLLKDEELPLVTMRYFQGSIPAVTTDYRKWPLQIQAYSSESYDECREVHDRITAVLHRARLSSVVDGDTIWIAIKEVSDPSENYDHEMGDFVSSSLFTVQIIIKDS